MINRPYDRETAVYPLPYLRDRKLWPSTSRIDDGTKFVLWYFLQLPDLTPPCSVWRSQSYRKLQKIFNMVYVY